MACLSISVDRALGKNVCSSAGCSTSVIIKNGVNDSHTNDQCAPTDPGGELSNSPSFDPGGGRTMLIESKSLAREIILAFIDVPCSSYDLAQVYVVRFLVRRD